MKRLLVLAFIISVLLCQVCCAFQPDPDRWTFLGNVSEFKYWFDKEKIYFYKENGSTYADTWILMQSHSNSEKNELSNWSLYNIIIDVDKKMFRRVSGCSYAPEFGSVLVEDDEDQSLKPLPSKGIVVKEFAVVSELYNTIRKGSDQEKIFNELKAKANSIKATDIYGDKKIEKSIHMKALKGPDGQPVKNIRLKKEDLSPNRWQLLDFGDLYYAWLDKEKLYFYKEGNDTYADAWMLLYLKDDKSEDGLVILGNYKINLNKKEYKVMANNMYNKDGSGVKRYPIDPRVEKISSATLAGALFDGVSEIYDSINKRNDRDKVFAELKAKADSTEIYDPLQPPEKIKSGTAANANNAATSTSVNSTSESSVDMPFILGGGSILLLVGAYFAYRGRKNSKKNDDANSPYDHTVPADSGIGIEENASVTLDDLPKLKKMLDEGIITQEEFDRAKKDVLG